MTRCMKPEWRRKSYTLSKSNKRWDFHTLGTRQRNQTFLKAPQESDKKNCVFVCSARFFSSRQTSHISQRIPCWDDPVPSHRSWSQNGAGKTHEVPRVFSNWAAPMGPMFRSLRRSNKAGKPEVWCFSSHMWWFSRGWSNKYPLIIH